MQEYTFSKNLFSLRNDKNERQTGSEWRPFASQNFIMYILGNEINRDAGNPLG